MMLRSLARIGLTATLLLGAATVAAAQSASTAPIKDLRIFGDSLSDTGNMFALAQVASVPVEEPPSPPFFDGRFSNGPVWVESLAQLLGLDVDFETTVVADPLASNQAVGGAYTDSRNENFIFPPFVDTADDTGILSQVDHFADAGGKIKHHDLVIVWGGANNYIFDTIINMPPNPADVVDDLREAIENLYALGGRRFLIPNLPDFGVTPLAQATGLDVFLTPLVQFHNQQLALMLDELAEDLKQVTIVEYDVYSAFNVLIASGVFPNTAFPCLDDQRQPTGACPPSGESFDATGTLFWDVVHPTAAAHALLGMAAHAAVVAAIPTGDDQDQQ